MFMYILGLFHARRKIARTNLGLIEGAEVSGVDSRDYPDFSDAYIVHAVWANSGRPLTEDQLDQLNSRFSDYVYDTVIASVF